MAYHIAIDCPDLYDLTSEEILDTLEEVVEWVVTVLLWAWIGMFFL